MAAIADNAARLAPKPAPPSAANVVRMVIRMPKRTSTRCGLSSRGGFSGLATRSELPCPPVRLREILGGQRLIEVRRRSVDRGHAGAALRLVDPPRFDESAQDGQRQTLMPRFD